MTFADPHDIPPPPGALEYLRPEVATLELHHLAAINSKLDQVLAFCEELRPIMAQAAAMADQLQGQSPMQLLGSLFGR